MVGMLMIWEDLFQKTPSVAIRHHIYKPETVSANPISYYVTCWPKVRDVTITGLPPFCDEWRNKFFYLDIATCEAHVQRGLTDKEFDEVDSTYRLSDQRYNNIRGDIIVKPDTKFDEVDPKLKALAAAENVKSATSPPTSPEVV